MLGWVSIPENHGEAQHSGHLLRPSFYWSFLTRRWAYVVVPFVLISVAGAIVANKLPTSYFSEGKLLVQPQQISTELVRATVTGVAQDRLQVIQQRTMSRDNVVEIGDKFNLFPEARKTLPLDDFVALVKKNIKISVIDLTPEFGQRSRQTNPPVAFSVGFEYSDPDVAQKVASLLIKRFIDEDIRDRKERASNTTKFMTDEYEKLRAENAAMDATISEHRAKLRTAVPNTTNESERNQLSLLKDEFAQKSALYSDQHPIMKSIKRQIQLMETTKALTKSADAESTSDLDKLIAQQEAARKTLEQAASKMTAALAGENLEKNQQSEKLEILESAAVPQRPFKPNKLKIAASAMVLAFVAGLCLASIVEAVDTRIRSVRDMSGIVQRQLVSTVPFISIRAEVRRKNSAKFVLGLVMISAIAAVVFSSKSIVPQAQSILGKTITSLPQ